MGRTILFILIFGLLGPLYEAATAVYMPSGQDLILAYVKAAGVTFILVILAAMWYAATGESPTDDE